jgi:hypothetical protein
MDKLYKFYIWSINFCGPEIWTLRELDQKYYESFELCLRKRMDKISWTDLVRKEALHRVKGEGNILHKMK